jgi:hypothetical protein
VCFGGASSAEKTLSNEQAQFYQTLQNSYAQQFKGQTAILNQLKDSAGPVLDAGINQYGFSKPEDVALRTQADTGTATSYQAAREAVDSKMAGVGGGNMYLPSGTTAGIDADIAVSAAQDQATKELGITEAGYAQGRQNYLTAANVLSGTAGQMNPLGYSSNANTGGSDAFGSASTINQQDQAGWQAVAGILGGGVAGFAQGFGSKMGSNSGGSSSSNG